MEKMWSYFGERCKKVLRSRQFQQLFVVFLILALFMVWCTPLLFGQDEGGGKKGQTLWDVIKSGGFIGFFIIFLSIVGFGWTIMCFLWLRRDNMVPPHLVDQIDQLLEEEEYEEVMAICENSDSFFTNVMAATLPRLGGGSFDQVLQTIADAAEDEATKWFQWIGVIQLISTIAPMLGLLGTVTGMIGAFQVIATSEGSPSPAELADSIGMALVTTAEGLFVAIPLIIVYFFLRNKLVLIVSETISICEELLSRFRE